MTRSPHIPEEKLDAALRAELRWEALLKLSALLVHLACQHAAGVVLPVAAPRPKMWYRVTVLILTVLAVSLSVMVAWQFYSPLIAQSGLMALLQQIQQFPTAALVWLYEVLPASESLVNVVG
ncbi:MAG: hypothetical protein HC893_09050, partial [Chloroflexaceae bacterium]|nr:hypothetical protein [Chloroflexaceae bacterium]